MLNIDEISDIHSRIDQLVDHFCKGNKAAFGRGADIQSGVLAGIIGGRKNKPSFDVLQKLLTAYPTVNPTWLLFGRGEMLNSYDPRDMISGQMIHASTEQFIKAQRLSKESDVLITRALSVTHPVAAERLQEHQAAAAAKEEALMTTYFVPLDRISKDDEIAQSALLSHRLSISNEELIKLLVSRELRGKGIEGVGYLVSELAVREFLGEA